VDLALMAAAVAQTGTEVLHSRHRAEYRSGMLADR
jgi:hypothetical protein